MQSTEEKRKSNFRKRIFKIAAAILIAVILILSAGITFRIPKSMPKWSDIFSFFGVSADLSEDFTASFIDVGTADACCIQCNGKTLLIDCGEASSYQKLYAYCRHYGFDRFDAAIISHFDSDHYGSAANVMRDFGIDTIYTQPLSDDLKPDDELFENFKNLLDVYGCKTVTPAAGDTVNLGDLRITFISPIKEYDNLNDNSLVVKAEYKNTSFLFTGDISSEAENDILSDGKSIDCDVLKVAHHGSKTSSSEEFLKAVSPQISVISVGTSEKNLPDYDTVARVNHYSAELYTTASDSNIVISSDGNNLSVQTFA